MKPFSKSLVAVFALLITSIIPAQEQKKPVGLAYLLDDAVRIYVIDESRCSAKPDSKEGGRWYLIEGTDSIKGLRSQFSTLKLGSRGGCMCGGPDIHFFAETAAGETTYFGLDCEEYLDGVEIPKSLQQQLVPARSTFLGTRKGQAYIVDLPFVTEEAVARSKFEAAGYLLLTGGWWNGATDASPRRYYAEERLKETAPAYLFLELGPFRVQKPSPEWPKDPTPTEAEQAESRFGAWYDETAAATTREATQVLDTWLERRNLAGHLLFPYQLRTGDSGLEEDLYYVELFLDDEKVSKAAVSDPKSKGSKLSITAVEYRANEPFKGASHYQAALLLPDNPTPEMISKAKAVLPGIGRVIPLCECREKPRADGGM